MAIIDDHVNIISKKFGGFIKKRSIRRRGGGVGGAFKRRIQCEDKTVEARQDIEEDLKVVAETYTEKKAK
jgi:hypothetical protein